LGCGGVGRRRWWWWRLFPVDTTHPTFFFHTPSSSYPHPQHKAGIESTPIQFSVFLRPFLFQIISIIDSIATGNDAAAMENMTPNNW
jgi:hypothetical protein